MRTMIATVTALAGSLLFAPPMLGPTQAAGAPDLKNVLSATHDSAVTLVRGGGGGGHGGGFAMGGGHMGGGGWGVHNGGHEFVGRGFGPRFAAHEFHHGFNHDNFHHFHNRRFFVSNAFLFGGYPYYGYGGCYWLKRKAIITGSPYWWSRYEGCVGYY
jgi:hypothetical protein